MKEFLSNLFWKIVMPFFRLKWWWNGREERKRWREIQVWEYMLHGYKSCYFYNNGGREGTYCNRPRRFLWRSHFLPPCSKTKKCKHYFYDPIKSG